MEQRGSCPGRTGRLCSGCGKSGGDANLAVWLLLNHGPRCKALAGRGGQESGAAEAVGQGLGQVQEAEEQSGKS